MAPQVELRDPRCLAFKEPALSGRCSADVLASVRERGIVNPLLVDDRGRVYIGNQRLAAALELGLEAVPCWPVHSSDDVRQALRHYRPVTPGE